VLQSLRHHRRLIIIIALLVIAGMVAVTVYRRGASRPPHDEPDLPSKAEAPPDLQKLRDAFAAGLEAIERKDGPDAVRHLSSFDFGPRAVEEYRLYYLAQAYELAKNPQMQRATLAKLWRRSPKLMHAHEAAATLGNVYAESNDLVHASTVYAGVARREDTPPQIASRARLNAAMTRMQTGDVSGALFAARNILIKHPTSEEAGEAERIVRAIVKGNALPLTASERIERIEALIAGDKAQQALGELAALEPNAPHLKPDIQLQRGLALHRLRRYEDSNKALEPLTGGGYKQAIPALRYTAKNYAVVASAINPIVIKNVKEKKRVGAVKVRVGKGKKRRTVKKPKYQTVTKQVKLVDLAKKNKKAEYERLASERLKDLLSLEQVQGDLRLDVLNALVTRAQAKNQDAYVQELVAQIIKLDRDADPALQHFWDKGWAAYARGDLQGARKMFRFIADTYTHPNVRRQSEYWYARCQERLGAKEEASAIYQKLASAPYTDLYAMHAISRGAKRAPPAAAPKSPDWGDIAEKQMPRELQLAYELTALSAMRDAFNEIRRNARRSNTRFAEALMADVHNASGNKIAMYRSLRRAFPQLATVEQDSAPEYFMRMYYPMRYAEHIDEYAKARKLDPSLVRAIILQESYYNPRAKSSVGATGLMQLMPPTAKEHSRKLGIRYADSKLTDPEFNVRVGTYHLRMLIDMFRGNEYFAIASYNAGQGNLLKWRRGAPRKPLDEFLESIPFQETRNYVKRVTMLRSTYSKLKPST
jgi:soluble lytic murein transglycosylase-like protein